MKPRRREADGGEVASGRIAGMPQSRHGPGDIVVVMTVSALPSDAHPLRRKPLPAPEPYETPPSRLRMLIGLRRNPIGTWSRIHYESPIVQGRGLLGDVTVVSVPDGVRHVLLDNAANYPKDDLQLRVLSPGLGNGLLTAEGEVWRRTRRTLAPLFTPRRIGGFVPQMRAGAERLARRVRRRGGTSADMMEEMTRVTFDILSHTLFSGGVVGDADDVNRALQRFFSTQGRIDPLDIVGAPDWLPRIGRILARPSLRYFAEQIRAMLTQRRAMLAAGAAPDDILTALILAADPETGQGLSEAEIGANITTFIGAGHETTANTLTWALYLLSRAPDILERAEAEADALMLRADEIDDWAAAAPLLRAVAEETMRLYPAAATLSRKALAEDRLAGRVVPAGSLVLVSPWLLHRHRTLWQDPELFVPERFLPGARERVDRFAYLPFGAGPRICIGMGFALQEMVIVLAHLLHAARFSFAGDRPPEPVQRVTVKPDIGMPMRVTLRN